MSEEIWAKLSFQPPTSKTSQNGGPGAGGQSSGKTGLDNIGKWSIFIRPGIKFKVSQITIAQYLFIKF